MEEGSTRNNCEFVLNLDQWFRRKCLLKVFLIWSSDSPFVQRSVTICAILVEYQEEKFCENILNLDQMSFKIFIWSSGDTPVQWKRNHLCNFKRRRLGNIYIKLYEIKRSGSSGDVDLKNRVYGRRVTIAHFEPSAQGS